VNQYQIGRIREIEVKARMMADRARSLRYDVELAPMSAYERLIVHSVLADMASIKTESTGEGRERRIVIRYIADTPPSEDGTL
jgi:spoIIIJ-associated protein